MGRVILKLAEDEYVEWSSIVDAPVTYILSREKMLDHLRDEYGRHGWRENVERMKRADEKGSSAWGSETVAELIEFNRAGINETCLSLEQIRRRFKDSESYEAFDEKAEGPADDA
jgi:hypothetical protein